METTEVNLFKDEIVPYGCRRHRDFEEHLHSRPHGGLRNQRPLLFETTGFEEVALQTKEQPKVRIIRMRKVPFIDSTGIHNLTNLCEDEPSRRGAHHLVRVNPKVHEALKKSGFMNCSARKTSATISIRPSKWPGIT